MSLRVCKGLAGYRKSVVSFVSSYLLALQFAVRRICCYELRFDEKQLCRCGI